MDLLIKVSLGSLLLTLTIAAEEKKPSTEAAAIFVTPNYEPTTTTTTERPVFPQLRFTFPPPRTDQQRSQTKQKKTYDVPNIPATYESIVYNPDSKEATSIFSRSNFWDTPDSIIHQATQRKEGKNSIVTQSVRSEFSPNYRSIQTPLKEIQYKPPSPVEEAEERIQYKQPIPVEEAEERVEEPAEENESVKTENQQFEPYDSADFYGDVLNNIESIFTNEENGDSVKNLLPQFEEHSFENLQQKEEEPSEDYTEDGENLEEYDDGESESVQVENSSPPKTEKPVEALKQSPFPSVKIVANSTEKVQKKPEIVFSPWLPVVTTTPKIVQPWPLLKKNSPVLPKLAARRIDSPFMAKSESKVAQKIDDLYHDQHQRV